MIPSRWFSLSTLILAVAGIGCFCLSVLALGIVPGRELAREIEQSPVAESPFTPSQAHGREIYASAGCAYCHTEQVRHTAADQRRWGAPTQAWETRYEVPQLWGTRRVGPDLARESGVRSRDWQLAHLYRPQDIVPGSVMPGYPWLFEGDATRPTQDAQDLVNYLETLGRAHREHFQNADNTAMGDHPARAQPFIPGAAGRMADGMGSVPRGERLYSAHCSSCHGDDGRADTTVARALLPAPADLSAVDYSPASLAGILRHGVIGTAMPAWRDFDDQQLADVVAYVRTLHTPSTLPASDPALLARGATLYAQQCASCHGIEGDGQGPAASVFAPRPFSFQYLTPAPDEIDRVLREGVAGSAMPAFPGLNDEARRALAAYVRTLRRDTPGEAP